MTTIARALLAGLGAAILGVSALAQGVHIAAARRCRAARRHGTDRSISEYLPAAVKVPERGRAITLQDLSMHVSGLPRLPGNMTPKDPENPYADYSVDQLCQFLSTYQLPRDVGALYEYSNLGAGLLGHILSLRAGMDYESLVKARITGPLGMRCTTVTLTAPMQVRLAPGHDRTLQETKDWDLPSLAGAGALRSSANDMLMFLAAEMGYTQSALSPAMKAMLQPRRQAAGPPGLEVALAWHVFTANGKTIVWHNGGTGGYRSYLGFDPEARTGVVILMNASSLAGGDDIGRHLLDAKAALLPATSPALVQPKPRKAQLTFETDADGKVTAVVLKQNGLTPRAIRAN